ncbi:unnamed protein product [Angiostrongylus costaricensis]|uniref:UNC93-like protein MFSD11 n=1 Tax=Angiostrongylus costaricensis TaxID=334426 RepID=A0A158PDB8_ANGCS|nr:unnamed protein product [Angiostrongylus costaricensis]
MSTASIETIISYFAAARMQLSPRRHELLSVYMLGVGTLFMYLGYITQLFIAESVIHAVSVRRPGVISPLAGYYGQAFHYSAFAISSVMTPSIQHYVASKWILMIASVFFAVYYLGFIHLNNVYFYLSQALMGVGYSFYNNGEGAYLSEHSSRRTLESNTGIETAVGHKATRTFTDPQIQLIYGVFFILNVISVVIFALLPTKQYDSIASNSPTVLPNFKQQLKQFGKSFVNVNIMLLLPFFCYMGLIVSFVVGVYPTTLTFTSTFSNDIYIIAMYSMAMGAAEIFGGVVLRRLIKKCKDWSLCIAAGIVLFLTRFMNVTCWNIVLAVGLTTSTITFGIVARAVLKNTSDHFQSTLFQALDHYHIELVTNGLQNLFAVCGCLFSAPDSVNGNVGGNEVSSLWFTKL